MYFPNCGVNKDRTAEFHNYMNPSNTFEQYSETASLIQKNRNQNIPVISVLDPIFKIHANIRTSFSQIDNHIQVLDKIFKENKQPNFGITHELKEHVNKLNIIITRELENLKDMIILLDPTRSEYQTSKMSNDCITILNNIFQYHMYKYHSFKAKFKLEIEELVAILRVDEESENTQKDLIDFSPKQFNPESELFSDNSSDQNQVLEQRQRRENEEMEEICRKAQEIQSIFLELAELISVQGTIIDRIDMNIYEAKENAEKAHDEILVAEKYQRKSNRMYICAIILGIMVTILALCAIFKK